MRNNYGFWKMAWDMGCVSAEDLKLFVGIEITKEQYEELTGIRI